MPSDNIVEREQQKYNRQEIKISLMKGCSCCGEKLLKYELLRSDGWEYWTINYNKLLMKWNEDKNL